MNKKRRCYNCKNEDICFFYKDVTNYFIKNSHLIQQIFEIGSYQIALLCKKYEERKYEGENNE